MTNLKSVLCGLVIGMSVLETAPAYASPIYSAAASFSLASNPNGVWSYGTTGTTLGGSFSLFTATGTIVTSSLQSWEGNINTGPDFTFPFVAKNVSSSTVDIGALILPGHIFLHPGPGGEFSVVRFTAPQAGSYRLESTFEGRDQRGTTSDVHVLLNNSSLFNGLIGGFGASASLNSTLLLHAGDKLDFVVGYGTNGGYDYDSTGLAATLTAIPEPSTWTLLAFGTGLFSLVKMMRRPCSV